MKAKITYARLQERVAAAAGITKKEAQILLKEITAAVGDGLVTDGKVSLSGLGRFSRKVQSARRGRNPQTGKPIDIPEKNRVAFLPEAQWRRYVNRGYEQIRAVLPPPCSRAGCESNRRTGCRTRSGDGRYIPVKKGIAPVAPGWFR